MYILTWVLGILIIAFMIALITAYICFLRVFYFKSRKPLKNNEYDLPKGDVYEVFHDDMINWIESARTLPHEDLEITSFDGLTLRGKYYECKPGALMEILFHGYEGNSERDLSGGIERCFALGRNALVVDQRACGRSDGHIVSFGINERKDCKKWVECAIERFGKDVKIGITGISMGAATVMMASVMDLPENVKFVLADCGYSSQKDIISKAIKDMGLPPKLLFPFVKLGARLFGRFDLEETTPLKAMEQCNIPVIFVHGDADTFVPYEMSEILYSKCTSEKKRFITIPGAGHGLAFPVARETYIDELRNTAKEWNLQC